MTEDPVEEQSPPASRAGGDQHRSLRAKYLDYCSARLSEVFLSLSDERTYELMEEAAREVGVNPADLNFSEMMELATEMLRASVPLPDFESWAEDYRSHPERYDPYLLGFTEKELEDEDASPSGEPPREGSPNGERDDEVDG